MDTYYISSISLIRAHFFIVTFFKRKRELPGIPITRIVWRNVHPNYPNRQTLEFRSLCIHYICMHLSNFCKSRGEGSMRMKTLSKFDSDVASKSLFLIQQKPHLNTNRSFVTSLVSKFQLILIRHWKTCHSSMWEFMSSCHDFAPIKSKLWLVKFDITQKIRKCFLFVTILCHGGLHTDLIQCNQGS